MEHDLQKHNCDFDTLVGSQMAYMKVIDGRNADGQLSQCFTTSTENEDPFSVDTPCSEWSDSDCEWFRLEEETRAANDKAIELRPLAECTRLSMRHAFGNSLFDDRFYTYREQVQLQLRRDCNLWPNGTVLRIRFLNGSNEQQRHVATVLESCEGWTATANIQLQVLQDDKPCRTSSRDAEVRIKFTSTITSFVREIGTESTFIRPSEPTMFLDDDDAFDTRMILHEFGHALGLHHEHQRCVKDIELNATEMAKHITDDERLHRDFMDKLEATRIDPLPYEPLSVLHYDLSRFGEGCFVSKKPDQSRLWTRGDDFLTKKDRALMAFLYPLPAGGIVKPREILGAGARRPKSMRQVIAFPHIRQMTPRVMLGILGLHFCAGISMGPALRLQASSISSKAFHPEAFGTCKAASLSYIAIDASTANVQMSSAKTLRSSRCDSSVGSGFDEYHELKPNTSSKANVIVWIDAFSILNTLDKFDVSVRHELRLSNEQKRLKLSYDCPSGARLRAKWLVINAGALNIDGGQITWRSGSPKRGSIWFRDGLDLPAWGLKSPQVLIGINGFHLSSRTGDKCCERFFKVHVTSVANGGFDWESDTCHDECVQAIAFSWIMVPKLDMQRFSLPEATSRPSKW